MLQDKDIKKIQELQADFTPSRVSADDIFSRFKALKLSECFSEFNFFKRRGYDFRMVLAILVSMVVSPDKTVNSFLNSPTGEGSFMGKDVFYRLKNSPVICWRMIMWHLVHRFLKVTSQDRDVDDSSSRYLIFDDTTCLKPASVCRSLGYQYKQAKVMYQGVEICLFFSRRGKHDNWKVLLTTGTKLTFKKLIEHYQVRWVVEVFNRESKGALYRSMNADVLRETLDKRLWGLFIELVCSVCGVLEMDADDLLEKMLANPKAESMIIALCYSVMVKDD